MTCEMCRYSLPKDYPWRAKCVGCGNLHTLCVDCGCRYSRLTGLQPSDTWVELDACPDVTLVAQSLMGEIGESAEQAVWRVMRNFAGEPLDDLTTTKLLARAQEASLPSLKALTDPARPNVVGLRLADGREVWSG